MTAPGTLILVDLDNLVGGWSERSLPFPASHREKNRPWLIADDGRARARPRSAAPRTVVAFAMNAATVTRQGVTEGYLARFATAIVRWTEAHPEHDLELGLTLSMPQAADVLLERMLFEAATPRTAIVYRDVWLVTRDSGLNLSISTRLGVKRPRKTSSFQQECFIRHYRVKTPLRRSYRSALPPSAPPSPPAPAWTRRVLNAAHASWAVTQDVQVAAPTLLDAAKAIHRTPSLASQVGATGATLRGVGRASSLLLHGGSKTIGCCDANDGLELLGDASPQARSGAPERSALGIGACFVREVAVTARTRLPLSVLQKARTIRPLIPRSGPRRAYVDDAAVIRGLEPGRAVGNMAQLRLGYRRDVLVAELERKFGKDVVTWWVGAKPPNTSSTLRIEGLEGRLVLDGVARCRCVACRLDNGLVMRAVAPPEGFTASCQGRIEPGHVGAASARGNDLLLLALDRPLSGQVECVPIQSVSCHELHRRYPRLTEEEHGRLRALPLVVPSCQKAPAANVFVDENGSVSP